MAKCPRGGFSSLSLAILIAAVSVLTMGLLVYLMIQLGGLDSGDTSPLEVAYPAELKGPVQAAALRYRRSDTGERLRLREWDFDDAEPESNDRGTRAYLSGWPPSPREGDDRPDPDFDGVAIAQRRWVWLVGGDGGGFDEAAVLADPQLRLGAIDESEAAWRMPIVDLWRRLGDPEARDQVPPERFDTFAQADALVTAVRTGEVVAGMIWRDQVSPEWEGVSVVAPSGDRVAPVTVGLWLEAGGSPIEEPTAAPPPEGIPDKVRRRGEVLRQDEAFQDVLRDMGYEPID